MVENLKSGRVPGWASRRNYDSPMILFNFSMRLESSLSRMKNQNPHNLVGGRYGRQVKR
jgi:hypothetical protein